MNSVILVGRMAQEPELKSTTTGTSIATFTLAVDRRGGQEKQTDFVPCVAFGKTAEVIVQYIHKGHRAGITGSLQSRKYEKDGEKRTFWNVAVREVEFLESRKGSDGGFTPVNDEDIPF